MTDTSYHHRKSTTFGHIIVPLDQSKLAEQAIPVAAQIARASGGSLRFIHVVDVALDYAWQYGQDATRVATNLVASSSSRARTYLREISHREDLHGLHVETEVLRGNPTQAILEASQEHKADLIVLCSHGYTGFERWLLGSVASKLVQRSWIPILLLHADSEHSLINRSSSQGPLRVMVPLDGSLLAESALEPAMLLSHLLSPSQPQALHLTSVLPIDVGERMSLLDRKLAIEQARLYLAILEQRLLQREETGPEPLITSSVSINSDIAHTIVQLAETGKGAEQASGPTSCDVIAIATRGRSTSARWVMGSIAQRVLTTTTLPVLLIHPPQAHSHLDAEEHYTNQVQPWTTHASI